MNFEEFLTPEQQQNDITEPVEQNETDEIVEAEDFGELDVQKAVVESLAADKAAQLEEIGSLRKRISSLLSELALLKENAGAMKVSLEKVGEILAKNSELPVSNQVSLIDRNPDLDDRFAGETRDHVLEVLKEARDAAERDGRLRRAQLLEAILVANQPEGTLAKRRAALEKLFVDNQNILSGVVINELDKCNISYKNGEEYLLPKDILKRTY